MCTPLVCVRARQRERSSECRTNCHDSEMDWTAVTAALVGGLVGVAGTLGGTLLAMRHAMRTRWDEEQATAVGETVEIAARLEGRHLRRARSAAKGEPQERQQERRELCEEGLDLLYAKAARVRALVPALSTTLAGVFDTERVLRQIADDGLSERSEKWNQARANHRRAIDAFGQAASEVLHTNSR